MSDGVCLSLRRLAEYEYGGDPAAEDWPVDVEILGHVFEQSIGDLEDLERAAGADLPPDESAATVAGRAPSRRKRDGAFYTPAFVTRYVVGETLGPVLAGRSEALRQRHAAAATGTAVKALADPASFDPDELNAPQRLALVAFWEAWLVELETVRVLDPACGSGAFLLEAFDQMFARYRAAEGYLLSLGEPPGLFVTRKTILTRNLFGVDLNGEAVEIARLSCWIKTAEKGKPLTTLDANIVQGNSVAAPPSLLEAWRERFPEVMSGGGFDVVVANPPYVRQEWIKADKPFLEAHYAVYDGVADLYVYFYELGLKLLRPGGRLGYVVTNKWFKAGYGSPLRKFYGESAWVEQVVDFGHAKEIFPDPDVFPSVVVVRRPDDSAPPPDVRVCVIPREQLRVDDLARQIESEGVAVPRSRLGAGPWSLEPPRVETLLAKLRGRGVPLREYAGAGPLYGVKTGCNEAFVVDEATRKSLAAEHSSSAAVLRKYLRGQDVDRWVSEWAGEWMIFARRGIDIDQFPAVKRHLEQYRAQLEPKPKDYTGTDWPDRKPGSYKWFEL